MSDSPLVLKFDPNTIQHLGISLYSQLPSVLSELISNSWDADANNVRIEFIDSGEEKSIIFQDDGEGMSFDELNKKYLLIGRNRRHDGEGVTPRGRRVIGKKGLGKLSIFGICNEIRVRTVKDGLLNEFSMNLSAIKETKDTAYFPEVIKFNDPTDEPSGTYLSLNQVRRKSPFNCEEIARSLSKKFSIFDRISTVLVHEDDEVRITNELKFEGFNIQFKWDFPLDSIESDYSHADEIAGSIITLETPIKDTEMKGVYLISRGKLVNKAEFYGLRDTDQFHSYVTGYLEVDFIDEIEEDVISTDRHSLNWETEHTKELRDFLQLAIKKVAADWKKKRAALKGNIIKDEKGIDIQAWQSKLPSYEMALSQRIINPILENSSIDVSDSSRIIGNVIDKFENKTYKEYASKIADLSKPEEIHVLLELMEEWKAVESKQYCDLALSRIAVINKFEEYIRSDTKEVPTLHSFLKQFSWLLDPRILEFRDEITYSQLLRENYPDEELDIADRRIDFLCSNALGGILYVIEIKRSKYKIDEKALEQAFQYGLFLKERYASESGFSKVVSFVIGGEQSNNSLFKAKEEIYRNQGAVYVKTYRELLDQSKRYHREFIDIYNSSKAD
jgi:hypothetical protein